ncbi:FUSC family protein [Lampropedia cohaerens]|uniref:FUSC family protein n=1 Tax=Lampropedia cohaerens TaxID=1610491 RepID=UPI00069A3F2A|nr:FUSC family protein [Lampropedia cohaerens]
MTHAGLVLERLGFSPAALPYTVRTAVAACCAVALAWLLGLEHPQWSGMTVWAASQPMRRHLLEKGFFRIIGTVVGTLFGIVLLTTANGQQWVLVLGLSAWVGLCAGACSLIRGFASYGVMLAGYSAAMVALLHSPSGGGVLTLGIDRMLTVWLGVLVALAFGWLLGKDMDRSQLTLQVDDLAARLLEAMARALQRDQATAEQTQRLLTQMAKIDDELDTFAAGSLRARQSTRAIRQLFSAQVAALLWLKRHPHAGGGAADLVVCQTLREAIAALDAHARDRLDAALRRLQQCAVADQELHYVLQELVRALREYGGVSPDGDAGVHVNVPLALHRDWIGAREAAVRAGGTTLLVGMAWLASGWSAGAFMMLGTTIMTTVFANVDNPLKTLRIVAVGQAVGAVGALACRWLAWPLAGSEAGLILWMMPFILLGALIAAHRRSAVIGFDYNMVLLLLLQPLWPLQGDLSSGLSAALAVVLGPLIALCAYSLIFPVTAARRLDALRDMMVQEIEAMATRPDAATQRSLWQARLRHRMLRLVRWCDKAGQSSQLALDGCFALLMVGRALLHMDALQGRTDLSVKASKRLQAARTRLGRLGADPARAARALRRASTVLAGTSEVDLALLQQTTDALVHQQAFLQRGAPRR